MMSIMLYEFGKFWIGRLRERVGLVMYGCTFWYIVGLASEVVIAKKRKRSSKKQEKTDALANNKENIDPNTESVPRFDSNFPVLPDYLNDGDDNDTDTPESTCDLSIDDNDDTKNKIKGKNEENDENDENKKDDNEENNTDESGAHDVDDTGLDFVITGLNEVNEVEEQHHITAGAVNPRALDDKDYQDMPKYDDKVNFHLTHSGGMPFRDFCLHCPMVTFGTCWGVAMFDEGHEEACLCFQHWIKIRKMLMDRTPMEEIIQLHNKHSYICKVCKSMGWDKSMYIKDTRYVMRDLHIDVSMLSISPRFVPAIKTAITIMNNILEDRCREGIEDEDNESGPLNLFDIITFYKNGSFVVHCSVSPNKQSPLIISPFETVDRTGGECIFEEWVIIADKLQAIAIKNASKNKHGLHIPT